MTTLRDQADRAAAAYDAFNRFMNSRDRIIGGLSAEARDKIWKLQQIVMAEHEKVQAAIEKAALSQSQQGGYNGPAPVKIVQMVDQFVTQLGALPGQVDSALRAAAQQQQGASSAAPRTANTAPTAQQQVQQPAPLPTPPPAPPPAPLPAPPPEPTPARSSGPVWLLMITGIAIGAVAISAARSRKSGMNGLSDLEDCGCGG